MLGDNPFAEMDFSLVGEYPAEGIKLLNRPRQTRCIEANLEPNVHVPRGTVMAETSTPGLFIPYVDGGPKAKGILRFNTWADANGICTVDGPRVDEHGNARWRQIIFLTVPIVQVGLVYTRQLWGLTALAVQTMGARLLDGTIEDGVLDMP